MDGEKTCNCSTMRTIHAGIVQEGLILDYTQAIMTYFLPFIKKVSNVSFVNYPISSDDMFDEKGSLKNVEELKVDLDMVIHPASLQDVISYEGWYPSNTLLETNVLIHSSVPSTSDTYSFDFLRNGLPVLKLLFGFSFVTALIMTKWSQRSHMKVFIVMLKQMWNLIFIYFSEPISKPSRKISWRLAYGFWILGALFLGAVISCTFKSDVYSLKYLYIDNFEDWRLKNSTPIWVLPGNSVFLIFMNYLSEFGQQNFTNRIRRGEPTDIIDIDLWNEIEAGELCLAADEYWLKLAYTFIQSEDIKENKIYISKVSESLSLVLSFSEKGNNDPLVSEIINFHSSVLYETRAFDYCSLISSYKMKKGKWVKPQKEVTSITFKDTQLAFQLLAYGHSFSLLVMIIEVLLWFVIECSTKKHIYS